MVDWQEAQGRHRLHPVQADPRAAPARLPIFWLCHLEPGHQGHHLVSKVCSGRYSPQAVQQGHMALLRCFQGFPACVWASYSGCCPAPSFPAGTVCVC